MGEQVSIMEDQDKEKDSRDSITRWVENKDIQSEFTLSSFNGEEIPAHNVSPSRRAENSCNIEHFSDISITIDQSR